jgi:hypothetical protein
MSQLFLGYHAVFIKKGRIFQKESNLYENSYYEREEGSPYKKKGNLNSTLLLQPV